MKLLGEYTHIKERTKCLIRNYIGLIQVSSNIYLVTCTEEVLSSVTDNSITTKSKIFREFESASDYISILKRELKY